MDNPQRFGRRQRWIGFGTTFAVNLVLSFVPPLVFNVWAVQWVYVLPCAIIAFRRKRTQLAQGMLIAAGLTICLDLALVIYVLFWLQ